MFGRQLLKKLVDTRENDSSVKMRYCLDVALGSSVEFFYTNMLCT